MCIRDSTKAALANVKRENKELTGISNDTIIPIIIPDKIPIASEDITKCIGILYIGGTLNDTHSLHLYPTGVSVIHS